MAGSTRKFRVALICIVLMLMFLTVKEVGGYYTQLPVASLREEGTFPQEISLIVAAVVVIILISYAGEQSECSLTCVGLSLWSRTSYSLSALRC